MTPNCCQLCYLDLNWRISNGGEWECYGGGTLEVDVKKCPILNFV